MHIRGSRNILLVLEKGQETDFQCSFKVPDLSGVPLFWATSFVDRTATLSSPQRLTDIYTISRERKEGKKGER